MQRSFLFVRLDRQSHHAPTSELVQPVRLKLPKDRGKAGKGQNDRLPVSPLP
jgi:hypothetical protein